MSEPEQDARPRQATVAAWSRQVFANAGLAPNQAQLKAEGRDPAGPTDPGLLRTEDEIDARIENLLDLAPAGVGPGSSAGVRTPSQGPTTERWS